MASKRARSRKPLAPAPKAKWTWLIYMAGDNDLEGAGRADLAELKRVGSTPQVNVIVQFDTRANSTTRYRVEKGVARRLYATAGKNMGDGRVLTEFMDWGLEHFPAKHVLLDVWNHGGGWEDLPPDFDYDAMARAARPIRTARLNRARRSLFRSTIARVQKLDVEKRAIAIDCGSHDYLDNQELRTAVEKGLPDGRKVDVLGLDACLMNMLEIGYEMKDVARFMVGSEETEPEAGWPYAAILGPLSKNADMPPRDLARLIVQEYGKYFTRAGGPATQSALDLGKIGPVARAVDKLADALLANLDSVAGTVLLARQRALSFEDSPEYVDLGDFCAELAKRAQGCKPVVAAAERVLAAVALDPQRGFVVENATVSVRMARARGVSIYLPGGSQRYAPEYDKLRFSKGGKWDNFLKALVAD